MDGGRREEGERGDVLDGIGAVMAWATGREVVEVRCERRGGWEEIKESEEARRVDSETSLFRDRAIERRENQKARGVDAEKTIARSEKTPF